MQRHQWRAPHRRSTATRYVVAASLFVGMVLFNGCPYYDWDDYEYPAIVPKLISKDDLVNSIKFAPARDLVKPGKIYTKDNLLFVNEKYEGVHVIDNADPANPVKLGFIAVPGCIDMAMKANTLYVDNATDLVAINISDPRNPLVTERMREIFPPLTNNEAYYNSMNFDKSKFVIVGWKDTTIKGGGEYAE